MPSQNKSPYTTTYDNQKYDLAGVSEKPHKSWLRDSEERGSCTIWVSEPKLVVRICLRRDVIRQSMEGNHCSRAYLVGMQCLLSASQISDTISFDTLSNR